MPLPVVELRCRTVTRPAPALREAITSAEAGDDTYGANARVNALRSSVARLFGHPGAAAHALAAAAGVMVAAQVRLNAELGVRLGSALVAASVSFAGGLVAAGAVVCASRRARTGVGRLRRNPVPWWTYLSGASGALFITVAVIATPILGVAAVSIAAVAGQVGGALATDHAGLPGVRRAVTPTRLAGGLVALTAVVVSRAGDGGVMTAPFAMTGIVVAAGVGIAVQSALNARLRTAASPLLATTINYAVGLAALALAILVLAVRGAIEIDSWPSEPLLYTGGALGAAIIASTAVAAAAIGVLRMTLAVIVGQLAAAALLDAVLPAGPGLAPRLLLGVVLTVAAVVIVGSQRRAVSADPVTGPSTQRPAASAN